MDRVTRRKGTLIAKASTSALAICLSVVPSFSPALAQSVQPTVVPAAASSARKSYLLTPPLDRPRPMMPGPDPSMRGLVPDVPAWIIYQPMPSRPSEAIRQHLEGTTIVIMSYGSDGNVIDVIVYKSSGYRVLDRAAMDAAKTWRIKPGVKDGVPLQGRMMASIAFTQQSR